MFDLTLVRIGWRNLWRNPRRTWLTVAAIAFACLVLVFMLSFQLGSYATMIDSSVHSDTGRTSRSRPRAITATRSQTASNSVR